MNERNAREHPIHLDEAHALQAGLIVMGKHGRSGLENLMLGSVTEGVLYGLDRDLLVVTECKE